MQLKENENTEFKSIVVARLLYPPAQHAIIAARALLILGSIFL